MGWFSRLLGLEEKHEYSNIKIKGGFEVYYDGKPIGYQIMEHKEGYYIYKNHKIVKDPVFFNTLKSANMGVMIIHRNIGEVVFNE